MTSLLRLPFRATLALVALCVLSLATPVAAGHPTDRPDRNGLFPDVIDLPAGWQAEGIATGHGSTVYAGSLANGAIWRGDLRTGQGSILVPGSEGKVSVGLKYHAGLLFVAGGTTGMVRVHDARTGEEVHSFLVGTPPVNGAPTTFVNDVTVTREAAWFTDSFRDVLYRLALRDGRPWGDPVPVALGGEWEQRPGFNANGIAATPDGQTLLVVNSTVGKVYRVRAETGVARAVVTSADLTNGDGILLRGRELDVVRNQDNKVEVLKLSRGLRSARLVDTLEDPDLDVPATIAEFGCALYAVNARFTTPPAADTAYQIVRVKGSCGTSLDHHDLDHHGTDRDDSADWRH